MSDESFGQRTDDGAITHPAQRLARPRAVTIAAIALTARILIPIVTGAVVWVALRGRHDLGLGYIWIWLALHEFDVWFLAAAATITDMWWIVALGHAIVVALLLAVAVSLRRGRRIARTTTVVTMVLATISSLGGLLAVSTLVSGRVENPETLPTSPLSSTGVTLLNIWPVVLYGLTTAGLAITSIVAVTRPTARQFFRRSAPSPTDTAAKPDPRHQLDA